MAFEFVTEHTDRGAAIRELQGLTTAYVANGSLAATNIPVPGIKTTDTLQSVVYYPTAGGVQLITDASITSAGNIQSAATATNAGSLLVNYFIKPNK